MNESDPRQLAALDALRPDVPAARLVIYPDGTVGLAIEEPRAQQIAERTRGIIVRLLPDPRDLPPPKG